MTHPSTLIQIEMEAQLAGQFYPADNLEEYRTSDHNKALSKAMKAHYAQKRASFDAKEQAFKKRMRILNGESGGHPESIAERKKWDHVRVCSTCRILYG